MNALHEIRLRGDEHVHLHDASNVRRVLRRRPREGPYALPSHYRVIRAGHHAA